MPGVSIPSQDPVTNATLRLYKTLRWYCTRGKHIPLRPFPSVELWEGLQKSSLPIRNPSSWMCVERDDNVDRTKNSSLYQESSNNYKWMRSLKTTQESSAYAQSFNIYKSILSYVHLIQFHQNGDGFYITSNLFHFWGSDCPKLHLILSEEVLGSSLLPGPQAA